MAAAWRIQARAFDYHPAYFSRIFREHFACLYNKFTNKLKTRRLASDLKKNHFIKLICEKYEYASVESFSKAFQKEFGMPPRQFKELLHNSRHALTGIY